MINRVNDSATYTNPYQTTGTQKVKNEELPPFLLNYDEDGVVWDRDEEKKTKAETKKPAPQQNLRDTYEPSEEAVKMEKTAGSNPAAEDTFSIRSFLSKAASAIKNIFSGFLSAVWYGEENKTGETASNAESEEAAGPAHNSSLLTTYNKFGNVTTPGPKESQIILNGDKYIEL